MRRSLQPSSREIPKPPEPWRAINPYRGLLALEEQDADFFFGRDRETGDIPDRLIAASGRFIALVGNSGVGKSSLMQAGVIGLLKPQRCQKMLPHVARFAYKWYLVPHAHPVGVCVDLCLNPEHRLKGGDGYMSFLSSAVRLIIASLVFSISVGASSAAEYWVAAQDVGKPISFFSRDGQQITVDQIAIGDALQSGRQINVRRNPADWTGVLFVLDKNDTIRVEEKRVLTTSAGTHQLWLRISTASSLPESGDDHQEATAKKIVSCFNAGAAGNKKMTIGDMRDCAGVWVSPRALVRCAVGASCSVLPDTFEGRAAFDAILHQYEPKLTRESTLSLNPGNLPPLPSAALINQCKQNGATGDAYLQCIGQSIDGGKYRAVVDCFAKPDEAARLACFADKVQIANFTVLMGCMSGGPPSVAKLTDCTLNPKIKEQAEKLRQCTIAATTPQAAAECISAALPAQQKAFADCVASVKNAKDAAQCLDKVSPDIARARATIGCLADNSNNAISCASNVLPGNAGTFAKCVSDAHSADKWATCAASANSDFARARDIATCVETNQNKAACATQYIGGDASAFAACLAGGKDKLEACVAAANPTLAEAQKTFSCVSKSSGTIQAFTCVAPRLGGDAARIAACVANPDKNAAALCLLGDKPEVRNVQRAYRCISGGSTASDLIANCSEGILDPKTSQTVACVARASSDKAQLAACAASAALPPDTARLVGCAASSQGATSFALCAAGPAMNEEWRIAAECAVQSGGNPAGFAGCTAGRLTVRELTKCLTGQIGKDCFGPNNTIIKAYANAFHDLTQGPGENNEVVKFVRAVGDLTGGPNSVINNPGQLKGGPGSMINNPAQIWGGDSSVFNQAAGGPNSEARKVLRALDPTTWRW